MSKAFVFYWEIPCAGIMGVFENFIRMYSLDSIVVTNPLSSQRKNMGWEDYGNMFSQHIIVNNWEDNIAYFLEKYSDRIHIFNGITREGKLLPFYEEVLKSNVKFCIMAEAYCNLYTGYKFCLKQLYLKYLLPYRIKKVAKKATLIFCLSGKKKKDLHSFELLGFDTCKIIPYGYWTNVSLSKMEKSENEKVEIICPGMLYKYKGVDLLLKAARNLKRKGITSFLIHITGCGPERNTLWKYIEKCELSTHVEMEGVLSADDFNTLVNRMDILVAPGRIEPWGIRINEAIQRGQVVIVSDGLGASDLIEESGGGSVFKSKSIRDLTSSLQKYILDKEEMSLAKRNNLKYRENISCEFQAAVLYNYLINI